ncbi:TetR/AcrR family transcriptional regulator [Streptomyces sp. NPDC020096]
MKSANGDSDGPASGRPSRQRLAPEDRRQALIETALDLFASRPYDAVSADDLARAAGVSRPLLYHYFGNKYGLFLAALQQCADRLERAVRTAARAAPQDWLGAGLAAYLHHIHEDALGYTALLGHGSGTATREEETILDGVRERILELIVEGMALPEAPALLRSVLRGWICLVEMVCRDWLRGQDRPEPNELVELLRELLSATVLTAARHDPRLADALGRARGLAGAGVQTPAAAAL